MNMNKKKAASRASKREEGIVALLVLLLLLLAPLFIYPVFVMKFMCMALFAASLNLLVGYAGLLSFGHAAVFGTGAYIVAVSAKYAGLDPLLCLLLAAVGAASVGAMMGFIAIRRKGIYFAMITLAIAQMVAFIVQQSKFSGGEDGLHEVPRGMVLGLIDLSQSQNIYGFVLAVFTASLLALWRTVNSPFGHILQAIREHETRAVSIGYDIDRYKLAAFVICSAFAGIAGGLNALVFQFATLADLSFHLSGEAILMVLIGGVGTVFGPLIGAALVVFLQSFLATSEFPAPIIIGAVFIFCVLALRRGVVGELLSWRRRAGSGA